MYLKEMKLKQIHYVLKNDSFFFEADISADRDSVDEARDVSAASSVWSS